MKTDEFISMLASGEVVVTTTAAAKRYAIALLFGALGATVLMVAMLGIRHDLPQAIFLPMFWVKIGFVACLSGASLFAALRLSRPGARLAWVPIAVALPVLGMWVFAAVALYGTTSEAQSALFFGETWKSCPLLIAMLSIPVFIAVIRVMHELAPTRPRLAGCSAGLLSGATAAVVYCFHCPEMDAPFIGFWYLLGTLIPALVGSLVGNAYLRW